MRVSISFTSKVDSHTLYGRISDKLSMGYADLCVFLTITTYGIAIELSRLKDRERGCIILDEAQTIKGPLTKQTRAFRELKGAMRIVMTGTSIENDLSNLWPLFNLLGKGLLGTATEPKVFVKRLEEHLGGYRELKATIVPLMLRCLKTDKTIISDPPEKLESNERATLSKQQAVLYRKLIIGTGEKIEEFEGMKRCGLVLFTIIKLEQICNRPGQYPGEEPYRIKDSGKLEMPKEICEMTYEKGEWVLVLIQYKEITPYLYATLAKIFYQEGYILHDNTSMKKRSEIVVVFQQEVYVPYIVLPLRVAGIGLNLTATSYVIRFDRWWNLAAEDQTADRVLHIGRKKNVIVHKPISKGTVEEKIDELIKSKVELSQQVTGDGKEAWITEMNNEEPMNLLRLDARWAYEQILESSRIFSAIDREAAI